MPWKAVAGTRLGDDVRTRMVLEIVIVALPVAVKAKLPGSSGREADDVALMARRPIVPSEPLPERMTPMLRACRYSDRERRKKSMGRRKPRGVVGSNRCSTLCRMDISLLGGDDVDAVLLDLHPVPDLNNLHPGGKLQEFGHESLVRRVEMVDDDKGHAAALWHVPQELFQSLQSTGGADADNEKREPLLHRWALFWRSRGSFISAGRYCFLIILGIPQIFLCFSKGYYGREFDVMAFRFAPLYFWRSRESAGPAR